MTAPTKPRAAKLNGGPPADRVIDLAAARVARLEGKGIPVTLKWDEGITFTLPVELPADFAMSAQEGNMREAIAALIGERAEEFFALRPSMDDLKALADLAAERYGLTLGESAASDGS